MMEAADATLVALPATVLRRAGWRAARPCGFSRPPRFSTLIKQFDAKLDQFSAHRHAGKSHRICTVAPERQGVAVPEDAKLATHLKMARTADKTNALFFSLVMKGGADGALIVAKKKVSPKDIKAAKDKCGGTAVLSGRCFSEDGKVVFEMPKTPPGAMTKVLKTIITRDAGFTLNVLPRQAPDADVDEADEAEGAAGESQEGDEPNPEAPTANGQAAATAADAAAAAAQFKAWQKELLFKAQTANDETKQKFKLGMEKAQELAQQQKYELANTLLDKLETMLDQAAAAPAAPDPAMDAARLSAFKRRQKELLLDAVRASNEVKAKIKLGLDKAQQLAGEKKFDQADLILDKLDALLGAVPAAPAANEAEPPNQPGPQNETPPADPAAAQWETKLAALTPRYEEALRSRTGDVGRMRAVFAYAEEQATAGAFAKGVNALKQLELLLNAGANATPASEAATPGLVKYRQTLLKFKTEMRALTAKLDAFKAKAAAALPEEEEVADEMVDQIGALQSEVQEAVDEAMNVARDERQPYTDATRAKIRGFVNQIKSNPLVKHIDQNPFAPVGVEATVTASLNEIIAAMV